MKAFTLTFIALLCATAAFAQKATKKTAHASASMEANDQRRKAIWEPISYPEDLELTDVFFVTDQEGWVAGGKDALHGGVVLHTGDGGDHWDVQVGDPESSDRAFRGLRFIDPTHGWATQTTGSDERLLHTADGAHWQLAGKVKEHYADYQFTSDSNGVVVHSADIYATRDGGRSWDPVFQCRSKAEVNGLTREVDCEWVRLQFLTPQTGYAIGKNQYLDLAFVARTDDGGQNWNLITSPVSGRPEDAFFIDEKTGYIRTGYPDTGQLFKTTDGGATWQGMAGSPGKRIAFADPQVGWSILYNKVSFTNDGGDRWNSRQYPFPAAVNAFSLPRRDRGYVVGNHGMIYRYRLVPTPYTAKGMIEAPRLAAIDFTVPKEIEQLGAQVQSLQAAVGEVSTVAPDTGTTTAAGTTGTPPAVVTQQIAAAESTLNTVAAQTPAFASRYRNLNLLMVGLQMTSSLPQQIVDLKQSFATLKTGKDAQVRANAVADFSTKLQSVITFMNTNFHSPLLARKK
ncbi:MAG TPA: YCF48-related protein [Thermoanaerobaculia bacterium]